MPNFLLYKQAAAINEIDVFYIMNRSSTKNDKEIG
jgi:hypothetical protein